MKHANRVFAFSVGIILGSIAIVSILYLRHINTVATKGYEIKQLHAASNALQLSIDTWNLKVSHVHALTHIQESKIIQNMKPASQEDKRFYTKDNLARK